MLELDFRFTFDSFVVGPANRLATAAAKRVAEAPGDAYNPLFIYSGSGLGKTHLLTAIGNHAQRLHPDLSIVYDTLEHFMEEAFSAIERGQRDEFRNRIRDIGLLLLDDVQFLAGHRTAQDEIMRALDALQARRGQLVLASDRPPAEMQDLDDRLLSRFSGGLVADIGAPDYEMRVAIVKRKAEERGHTLDAGVAEALARVQFGNVRELQGGLNRLLAVQELDGRSVSADEVASMFGEIKSKDDFGSFLDEIADTVDSVVASVTQERRLAETIMRYEGEGYATRRLEAALHADLSEADVDDAIYRYESDVRKLQDIEREIGQIEPHAPELRSAHDVLRNPDRVHDAEALLVEIRERNKQLPGPPPHRSFDSLAQPADTFAVRAARSIVENPGKEYNPLFIHGPEGAGKTTLLAAVGNEFKARNSGAIVGFLHGKQFVQELIESLERNTVDSWRTRYRKARFFVLDDVEALMDTERAQEELFHLFEDLKRNGAQMAFGAAQPPSQLAGFEERLRSRLDSGLVVALEPIPVPTEQPENQTPAAWVATMAHHDDDKAPVFDEFFLSREKVIWNWPYLEDCIFEELG
ncbi:MAG TPA: DnaA/Hda family protein [Longimicrobiales bacterium]